jgi:hypothetical protein
MKNLFLISFLFSFFSLNHAVSGSTELATTRIDEECAYEVTVSQIRSNTHCNTPTGELLAEVSGASGNLTFSWFPAEHLNDPDYLIATEARVSNLEAGNYTVVVTDEATACSSTATGMVADETQTPVLELLVISDEVNCDGASSGHIEANLLDGEGSENIAIKWYNGPEVDAGSEIPTARNMMSLTEAPAGVYTAQATNGNTGCHSDPVTVEIQDLSEAPQVAGAITNNTACDISLSNGSISLHINASSPENEPENGYEVEWFYAGGEAVEIEKRAGNGLENLTAGTYTVLVTNLDTRCQTQESFTVEDDTTTPVLSLASAQANTVCDPEVAGAYNGAISVELSHHGSIIANPEGYKISWYEVSGDTETLLVENASLSIDQLPAGQYQVMATHEKTGCVSAPVSVVIEDATEIPVVEISHSAPVTHCETPDGVLEASVVSEGDAGAYSLEWYAGEEVDAANLIASVGSGEQLTGLSAGAYTVMAIHQENGCVSAPLTINLQDETILPQVEIASLSHVKSCDEPDGAVELSISPGGQEGQDDPVSIRWYAGDALDPEKELVSLRDVGTASGLSAGMYAIEVINQESACRSLPLVVEVLEQIVIPEPEIVALQPQTHCVSPDGAIEIAVPATGDVNEYTISWYEGPLADPDFLLADFSDQTSATGLAAGAYTVRITYVPTGCSSEPVTLEVEDATLPPSISVELSPVRRCNDLKPDGSVSFEADGEKDGYSFVLYAGSEADPANKVAEGAEIEGLAPGEYLVVVTNETSACQSSQLLRIETALNFPEAPKTVDAESCEAAELTLSVEGDQTYYWYEQASGGTAFHAGDTYFDHFTETTTFYVTAVSEDGCESTQRTAVSAIIYDLPEPQIQAEANQLSTTEEESYTYRWYLDGELLADETSHELEAEKSGSYAVEVINPAGCSRRSAPYEFSVSGLIDQAFDAGIRVYPNPFHSRLYIEFTKGAEAVSIKILDGQMKLLKQLSITGYDEVTVLDLAELPQGLYFIQIREGERVSYRRIARQ